MHTLHSEPTAYLGAVADTPWDSGLEFAFHSERDAWEAASYGYDDSADSPLFEETKEHIIIEAERELTRAARRIEEIDKHYRRLLRMKKHELLHLADTLYPGEFIGVPHSKIYLADYVMEYIYPEEWE